jgi:fibronectin type 3 domain-containing protein
MNKQLITADSFDDTSVNGGSTYYSVSTSVDATGKESQYSAQATAKPVIGHRHGDSRTLAQPSHCGSRSRSV